MNTNINNKIIELHSEKIPLNEIQYQKLKLLRYGKCKYYSLLKNKIKYGTYYEFENNFILFQNKIDKIYCDIKCIRCNSYKKLLLPIAANYQKEFLCRSCLHTIHNPMYGKKHTDESKKKMSINSIGKNCGKMNGMYKRSMREFCSEKEWIERYKKHSKLMQGSNNPMYGKSIKDFMSTEAYEKWRKHFTYMCKNKTTPEIKTEKWLTANGFNVQYSYFLTDKITHKTHQYDLYLIGTKILVEVQGDYWHGNPLKYNLDGSNNKLKLNKNQLYKQQDDITKKELAEKFGYTVYTIWEYDINNNDFSSLLPLIQKTKII